MAKKALIVWGGWDGHEPGPVAEVLAKALREKSFEVEVSDTLDAFKDVEKLKGLDLIVPIWTMGHITGEQAGPVFEAVKAGVGLGGCHGGMCDAFRENTDWHFMTGGQWVAHPGNDGVEYTVKVTKTDHFIMQGTSDFQVKSEQYYMHTDPSNDVLATTKFPIADGPHVKNGEFEMPVVWTRYWGEGRVYYNSLGHHADVVAQPEVLNLMVRGLLWAAHAEDAA